MDRFTPYRSISETAKPARGWEIALQTTQTHSAVKKMAMDLWVCEICHPHPGNNSGVEYDSVVDE